MQNEKITFIDSGQDENNPMNNSIAMKGMSTVPRIPPPPTRAIPVHGPMLGPENTIITCPHCLASVKTSVRYTTTSRTHIAAILCCIIGCCCIPYCLNSAKNTDHYCPNCAHFVGTYEK